MQEHGILRTRLCCPVLREHEGAHPRQHLRRHKGPDPEADSPHLPLCTPSRLTGTAAPRNRTQLRPENSYLLHRGFTCLICDDLLEHKKPIGGPGLTV